MSWSHTSEPACVIPGLNEMQTVLMLLDTVKCLWERKENRLPRKFFTCSIGLRTSLIHALSVWVTLVTLLSDCSPIANALPASRFYWALFALSCFPTADWKCDWLSSKVPANFTCLVWWISFWSFGVWPYCITDRWRQLNSCCALEMLNYLNNNYLTVCVCVYVCVFVCYEKIVI